VPVSVVVKYELLLVANSLTKCVHKQMCVSAQGCGGVGVWGCVHVWVCWQVENHSSKYLKWHMTHLVRRCRKCDKYTFLSFFLSFFLFLFLSSFLPSFLSSFLPSFLCSFLLLCGLNSAFQLLGRHSTT
jgi:hypothetical protein